MEPPNTTDVEGSIKKLKANDKGLKELNLNNIKVSILMNIYLFNGLQIVIRLEFKF